MCTFGTEFVVMVTGLGLGLVLDTLGECIPINGVTQIYDNSMSVINNTSKT